MTHTAESVRQAVNSQRERLFSSYAFGRSSNWVCDQRTKDTVCISVWLRESLTALGLDELDRKTQENVFYRYARNDNDLFGLAAQVMNDAASGNIDRNRKTHRRWG